LMKLMVLGGMAIGAISYLHRAMKYLQGIETKLELIRQELSLKYDSLDSRIKVLEARTKD
jgi:hypothetical protein